MTPVHHASRRSGNRPPSRWTEAHDAALRSLNGEGRDDAAIARQIGFSRTHVRIHRVALGLPTIKRSAA